VSLVDVMLKAGPKDRLLDVQWQTDHLATLGVVAIPRAKYLEKLSKAVTLRGAFN
jgi:leucyl/phenylalanyl-tRNA--protein transferase